MDFGLFYKKLKYLYKMQSKIAIQVHYALYEITHMQYMYVINLFYYALTLIWPFHIKINIHKKNSNISIFYMHIICTFFNNFAMQYTLHRSI
jgi:hypothetical protein